MPKTKLTAIIRNLIRTVANENNIYDLAESDMKRAHEFANDGSNDEYYYKLKEYFINS